MSEPTTERMTDPEVLAELPKWVREICEDAQEEIDWRASATPPVEWSPEQDYRYEGALKKRALCRALAKRQRCLRAVCYTRNALGQKVMELLPEHLERQAYELLERKADGSD